jgi:hypothetical protein
LEPLFLVFDLFGDSVFAWFCGFVDLFLCWLIEEKSFNQSKKKKREEEEEDGGDMRGE